MPHHHHDGAHGAEDLPYFQLSLCFSVFIILVQLVGWFFSGSQALLADTGHLLIHAVTEIIVIAAILKNSERADWLGSLLITVLLLFLVASLIWGAYKRYIDPREIETPIMFAATIAGLAGNIAQRLIVRRRGLGYKSATRYKQCLDTDIYSSLGVLASAVIIYFNPAWLIVDTSIAFAIAGWIMWKVLKMSEKSHC